MIRQTRASKAGGGAASSTARQGPGVIFTPYKSLSPFPAQAIVTLRTSYTIGLASAAAAAATNVGTTVLVQLNSAWEPFDGQSFQPYGFDQMAALYGKYKVLKADLTYQVAGVDTVPSCVVLLAQNPTGGVTLAGESGQGAVSRPNAVSAVLPTTGAPIVTLRTGYKLQDVLGVTAAEFTANVEEYAAAVGANPTQMATVQVGLFSLLNTSQTSCRGLLTLVQQVHFFGRIGQAL